MATVAFTTSVRTSRGRLFIHVSVRALAALGADASNASSLLSTFARHATMLQTIALQRAERLDCDEVTVDAADIRGPACGA